MYILFLICVLGLIVVLPVYFLSVEHEKLQEKYGKERGTKIGEVFGVTSGWGFFIFWFGIWLSPQPRFLVPIFQNLQLSIPMVNITTSFLHLIISAPLFIVGAWFGIKGVRETTLQTAETHRAEKIVTTGPYSIIRHPQYLGGLLAHLGMFFLLSALYSLLITPLMVIVVYAISRKEEKELIKEFGREYEKYMKKVPMLIPRLTVKKK